MNEVQIQSPKAAEVSVKILTRRTVDALQAANARMLAQRDKMLKAAKVNCKRLTGQEYL